MPRHALPCLLAFLVLSIAPALSIAGPYDAQFRQFLEREIAPAAISAGVPQSVVTRELSGLTPDTSLPGLGRPDARGAKSKKENC